MSMLCPRCDHKLDCVDSRLQPTGITRRAYKCNNCYARVYTVEVMVKFKEAKGKLLSKDHSTKAAKRRADLAAEILLSQGIEL